MTRIRKISFKRISNNRGVVFIAAMAIMIILMSLGLAYLMTARTEMQIADNHMEALKAMYNAESGVAHSIAELKFGTDANGDGLGTIPVTVDGSMEYSATYANGMITATGTLGASSPAQKTIEVTLSNPWTAPLMAGGSVSWSGANPLGTINGDVDSKLSADLGGIQVNGTINQNNSSLTIPTPSLTDYYNMKDMEITGCGNQSLPGGLPSGASGIFYRSGSCTISGRTGGFSLNGTLIVDGNMTISAVSNNFTITPSGDNPALIVTGTLTISGIWYVNINGLIYAQNISIGSLNGSPSTITGSMVAQNNITFDWMNQNVLTINFDEDLNPPHFDSGEVSGQYKIKSWKGNN